MNFQSPLSPTMLLISIVLYALFHIVAGEQVIAESYLQGTWRDSNGCVDLQLNFSATSVITDGKMYLFANINDISNKSEIQYAIEVLIGSIDLKTAFTVDQYEIEWRTSRNFTFDPSFLSGDGSLLTFTGEHRTKFNVPTVGPSLITFDPATWGLDTIEWPATIPEGSLPKYALANVNVPELKMTYYSGPEPTTDKSFPNELFAYNYSDGSMTRHETPSKSWSAATFVPAGAKGMLVMVGGTERSDFTTPIPMDEIYVYDVANDKWYLQPTTGKAPPERMNNCAVVTAASDGSSYQIHVYGGMRPEDTNYEPIIDNYYVLSVPQFIWSKGPILPGPRSSPSCNLLGNHTMVISAGYMESTCVPLFQIVDLNTGNVTDTFNYGDTSAYQVPSFVVSDIGGGPTGGAAPANSFVAGFEAAWNTQYIFRINDTATAEPETRSPKKTPLGAIIGGTIGGVAAGVLILCAFMYWRRRNRQQPVDPVAVPMVSTNTDPTYPTDAYPTNAYPTETYKPSEYTSTGYPSPNYTVPTSPAPTYTTPAYPGGQDGAVGYDAMGIAASPTHELPGNSAYGTYELPENPASKR